MARSVKFQCLWPLSYHKEFFFQLDTKSLWVHPVFSQLPQRKFFNWILKIREYTQFLTEIFFCPISFILNYRKEISQKKQNNSTAQVGCSWKVEISFSWALLQTKQLTLLLSIKGKNLCSVPQQKFASHTFNCSQKISSKWHTSEQ